MHICQIEESRIHSKEIWGKWFCSDSADGDDGERVIRYLQLDGTWGRTTDYFDTREQLDAALAVGEKPDFTISSRERDERAMIRQDVEEGFNEIFHDDDYPPYPGYI